MRAPVVYKRRYVGQGEGCIPIYNRYAHAKRVELERKYFGKKDDVLEHVNTAKQVMQSLGSGGPNLAKMDSSVGQSEGASEDSVSVFSLQNMTFKDLVDHVNTIEDNYKALSLLIQNNPIQ